MITFAQLTDGNGNAYVQYSETESTSKINLSCGLFHIQRDFTPTGPHRFSLRHRDLYAALVFTRAQVTGGDAMTDAELEDWLVDLFNCCGCAGSSACTDCCFAPPGYSFLYFDFLPGNQLDDISQIILNIRAGFGDCDTPCYEIFSGVDMTPVTGRDDFVNQLSAYLNGTPPPGYAASWPTILGDGTIRLVVLMSEQQCCGEPIYMGSDSFGCDSGPFDPEFFRTSPPELTCCSGPVPCIYDLEPGQSGFQFGFGITPGAYNATGCSIVTHEGDCWSEILGNLGLITDSDSASNAYYTALLAHVGTNGIVSVTQVIDGGSNLITVVLDFDTCCGNTLDFASTNGAWNTILNDPLQFFKTEIYCCP